jgi:hypothetical protein
MSAMSVSHHGKEVNIEDALDEVIRGLQGHLNDLQYQIRTIAMTADQFTGDGDDPEMTDLKLSLEQSDAVVDNILEMHNLFDDLIGFGEQMAFKPINAAEKAYTKAHKAQRKKDIAEKKRRWEVERVEEKKRMKQERKEEVKA